MKSKTKAQTKIIHRSNLIIFILFLFHFVFFCCFCFYFLNFCDNLLGIANVISTPQKLLNGMYKKKRYSISMYAYKNINEFGNNFKKTKICTLIRFIIYIYVYKYEFCLCFGLFLFFLYIDRSQSYLFG